MMLNVTIYGLLGLLVILVAVQYLRNWHYRK